MQIGKWGNSLAVRLPASVVERLDLKEGDHIQIGIEGKRHFTVGRDDRREQALAQMRSLDWELPPGFRFNRDDAHDH